MVSKESDVSTGHSCKQKYRELKRKLKYLVYENESFESDIRKAHATLLQISREKSFILDQLMSHETVVLSDDSDPDSTDYSSDDTKVPPLPNYSQSTPGPSSQSVTKATKSSLLSTDNGPSQQPHKQNVKTRGSSSRKGGRGGASRGAGRGSKTSNKTNASTLKGGSTTTTPHSNTTTTTTKVTPSLVPPLSLIVSLPRVSPSHSPSSNSSILPLRSKPSIHHPPPPLAAARKKMKMISPSASSSSSSSSSDSDSESSDSSESLLLGRKPSYLPPPPPLQSIAATPVVGGASLLLTPTPIQSSPVNLMTPNALTTLALVPSSNLSRLSPGSPSVPSGSSSTSSSSSSVLPFSGQHRLLSLGGERGVATKTFQIVTTTSNVTPHNNR